MSGLISVIMPVYNCEAYVAKAIDSILRQTYSNFELIILDDGSTDNTHGVISNIKDNRIRYYQEEKNIGKVSVVNKALSLVRGEYIAMQDADDWSEPTRLEKQLLEFKNGEVVACFTGYNLIGHLKHGKLYRVTDELLRQEILDCGFLEHRNFIPTHCATMMVRSSVIQKIGGYSPFFLNRVCEDIHWISRILREGKAVTVPEELYNYLYSREGSFTFDTRVNLKPSHLYGVRLAAGVIEYESNTASRIELADAGVKESLEFESCKATLVDTHRQLSILKHTYEKSAAFRIGSFVLYPWRKIRQLF